MSEGIERAGIERASEKGREGKRKGQDEGKGNALVQLLLRGVDGGEHEKVGLERRSTTDQRNVGKRERSVHRN